MQLFLGLITGSTITAAIFIFTQQRSLRNINEKHQQAIMESNVNSQKNYQQELEKREIEISRLKSSLTQIKESQDLIVGEQSDRLNNLQKTYQQNLEQKEIEISRLKSSLMQIKESQDLIFSEQSDRLNNLQKTYQQNLEQKEIEISRLKNSLIKVTETTNLIVSDQSTTLSSLDKPVESIIINPTDIYSQSFSLESSLPDNYVNLQRFLIEKMWQKADEETAKIMFEITRNQSSNLTISQLQNFPLQDLALLDGLWTYYSDGHFGFSIQRKIYLDIKQKFSSDQEIWRKVGGKLGWNLNNEWLFNYGKLTFSKEAPSGQFPFLAYWKGMFLGGFLDSQGDRFITLITRLADLEINR